MFSIAKALLMPALLPRWIVNHLATPSPKVQHQPTPTGGAPTVERSACPSTVRVTLLHGWPTGACLQVTGALDRFNYQALIENATTLYGQGRRHLLIDLRQTTRIELSGLFALLSIARLYSGQTLLDPESGLAGLRRAAETATPALGERVKLLASSPVAAAALQRAHFCQFFAHYSDLETALVAFPKASK
ncbi:MAG: hypothetical protein KJZ93_29305 [Caldilineaceae bacterium]|nr:hypothetical protein [Caldilineaceae bacterium]